MEMGRDEASPRRQSCRLSQRSGNQAVCLLPRCQGGSDYEYTILCFCWTAKTTSKRDRIPGSLPSKGAPEAIIQYLALRNGPSDEEFSEDVDLQLEYEKEFSKPAPEVWAIGIGLITMGPNTNGMTTDAVISDIRITN